MSGTCQKPKHACFAVGAVLEMGQELRGRCEAVSLWGVLDMGKPEPKRKDRSESAICIRSSLYMDMVAVFTHLFVPGQARGCMCVYMCNMRYRATLVSDPWHF